jgi:hypothetical protein
MVASGEQSRPARVLLVAGGTDVGRVGRVLRAEGYVVELVRDGAAIVERLACWPPIDIVAINGLEEPARGRALAAAREQNVWCIYLAPRGARVELLADERAEFVAAVSVDADHAQIARTLRLVVAARRTRAAEG